jgi:hypothetical protein
MRIVILILSLLSGIQSFAQKDCEFSTNIQDSIGTYRETKDFLMHEKVFGGRSTYLFFSLVNNDSTPLLKVQKIVKSADFIEANCFDSQSKIFLQLMDGKVVTLIYGGEEKCGSLLRLEEQKLSTRVIFGNFLFLKGSIEDLKRSPVSLIRIRFLTETEDLVVKKELVSELTKETYHSENYFIDNLHCVID